MLEHPKPTYPKKIQNFWSAFCLFCSCKTTILWFHLDVVAKSRAPLYTSFLFIIQNSLFFLLKKIINPTNPVHKFQIQINPAFSETKSKSAKFDLDLGMEISRVLARFFHTQTWPTDQDLWPEPNPFTKWVFFSRPKPAPVGDRRPR